MGVTCCGEIREDSSGTIARRSFRGFSRSCRLASGRTWGSAAAVVGLGPWRSREMRELCRRGRANRPTTGWSTARLRRVGTLPTRAVLNDWRARDLSRALAQGKTVATADVSWCSTSCADAHGLTEVSRSRRHRDDSRSRCASACRESGGRAVPACRSRARAGGSRAEPHEEPALPAVSDPLRTARPRPRGSRFLARPHGRRRPPVRGRHPHCNGCGMLHGGVLSALCAIAWPVARHGARPAPAPQIVTSA